MILTDIEIKVASLDREGFIRPQYGNYCFSNIPSFTDYLLGIAPSTQMLDVAKRAELGPEQSGKVIVFLIDGFGYNQWLEYASAYGFLERMTQSGVVAPLTAVFPSTTASSLTAIHSGLTPKQHGLLEWWVYFRELGRVIVTLPFMEVGGTRQDELVGAGVDPRILFDGQTRYDRLTSQGIRSYNLLQDRIAHSAYSTLVMEGSRVISFRDEHELASKLAAIVRDHDRAFVQVYWGDVDSAAHEHGVHSVEYRTQLDRLFNCLEREFLTRIDPKTVRDVTILVIADHGQVSVDPNNTVYLDANPKLMDCLRDARGGGKIGPWGNARDIFMAVRQGKLREAISLLEEGLEGKASVIASGDAVKSGLFGIGLPHKEFRSRAGDIMVLPRGNFTAWHEQPGNKRFSLRGMHGGMSADEMLVPLGVARLADII